MTALGIDPAALAEYELVDELRRLPYDHARKLARAATEAAGVPLTADVLDLLTDKDWQQLAEGVGEETAKAAIRAMVKHGSVGALEALQAEGEGERVLDELDADDVVAVLKRMYDLNEIDEVADLLDDDMREALRALPPDGASDDTLPAPAPAPKLWFVYQAMPRERGKRKRRVFRYVASAPDAEAAVECVRANKTMLHQCDWRAEELEGACAAIDWELEK